MSTRCRACDAQLTFFDRTVNKSDTLPEPEDLCSVCRGISYNVDYMIVKEYQHEHITENWVNFTLYKESEEKD